MGDINFSYCCITPTVLKWFELICAIVTIAIMERNGISGTETYNYIFASAVFCLVLTIVLLVIYFMGMHRNIFTCWSWDRAELVFNFIMAVACIVAFVLAAIDTSKMGDSTWRRKMIGICVSTGLDSVFYILSGMFVNQRGVFY